MGGLSNPCRRVQLLLPSFVVRTTNQVRRYVRSVMGTTVTSVLPDIEPTLAATDPAAMQQFNHLLIAEFRANGGQLSGQFTGLPMLLLNTRGTRSGTPRTTPIGYVRDGSSYVIMVPTPAHPPTRHGSTICWRIRPPRSNSAASASSCGIVLPRVMNALDCRSVSSLNGQWGPTMPG